MSHTRKGLEFELAAVQKWKARFEAAEKEKAALTKKVDELEAHKIDYLGIRSLCGLEDDDSTVADFIDNLFGRAETAEANLAEARAVIERIREPVEDALRFEEKQWGTSHAKRALKQILAFLPTLATEGGEG